MCFENFDYLKLHLIIKLDGLKKLESLKILQLSVELLNKNHCMTSTDKGPTFVRNEIIEKWKRQ